MRRMTYFVMALALVLGFTQCKKEQIEPQGGKVSITLNVENGGASTGSATDGAKVNVNENHVTFGNGDKILVAHDGKYVGTLTYTEYETGKYRFQGDIDADVAEPRQKLYFYFLGNKQDDASLDAGSTTSCTVNISDQTGYPALPVISFSASNEDFTGEGSYTASLHNKASLMKFSVTSPSTRPICITGMKNKVTIDFTKAASELVLDNNGFSYSVDSEDGGLIKMAAKDGENVTWAIVLPQDALAAGGDGTAYTNEETQRYKGNRPALDAISGNQYLNSGVALTVNTADNSTTVDLSKLVYDYCAKNSETLTGTLSGDYKISIAAGAEVTLSNVNINGSGTWNSGSYAGISCLGGAIIILADGTTNIVKGFNVDYPGIHVPSGSTLTIQGTGSLNASSNGWGAGIGGGYKGDNTINCGNIIISSGTVTATGGGFAAGIGSGGNGCSCGTITISGGTITATGGQYAAGIGSGYNESSCGAITISGGTVEATGGNDGEYGNAGVGIGSGNSSSCGAITIQNTVTRVSATKGGSSATNSIGAGNYGSCGTVTIGGVVGAISTSPYTYEPAPQGAISGKFSVSSTKQVYFSQGNLQYQASTSIWRFAENQWDYVGDATNGNVYFGEVKSNNASISSSYTGWIDLFGWGTSGWNCENTCYQPWDSNNSYGKYGPPGEYNLTGSYANSDWGYYNAISNGGNQSHQWRTLTQSEWNYVFNTRSTTSGIRYAKAQVNNVSGVILLPDNWSSSYFSLSNTNSKDANFSSNVISSSTWANSLEAHGAVFLPAAGYRDVTSVNNVGGYGTYWSASWRYNNCNAYYVHFDDGNLSPDTWASRHYGRSVRLVKDAN